MQISHIYSVNLHKISRNHDIFPSIFGKTAKFPLNFLRIKLNYLLFPLKSR
jgi:hypothetical protein